MNYYLLSLIYFCGVRGGLDSIGTFPFFFFASVFIHCLTNDMISILHLLRGVGLSTSPSGSIKLFCHSNP